MMKLSIITINYNNCAGLQKTIDSVICQLWRDFEWIVIDGGSTDGSKELIEKYQDHFAYWCSEPDKGVYNAMNKGIAKAKGEYLNFMNSGDIFYENSTLEKIFCENLFGDVVYGDWIHVKKDGGQLRKSPTVITLDFFYSSNICHQAMFIRSTLLQKDGYDESFHIYADWARWMKMTLDGVKGQYCPIIVCVFDAIDGLSNRNDPEMQMELNRIHEMVPSCIRIVLEKNIDYKKELAQYKDSQLMQDVFLLVNERPIFCKVIHLNILIVKTLRRFLLWLKI